MMVPSFVHLAIYQASSSPMAPAYNITSPLNNGPFAHHTPTLDWLLWHGSKHGSKRPA